MIQLWLQKKANDSILDEDFVSFCFWSSSLQCFLTTWRNLIGRLVHRISLYEHLYWIDWVSRWSWEASHVFILYNKITRRTEINCQYANKDSSTFFFLVRSRWSGPSGRSKRMCAPTKRPRKHSVSMQMEDNGSSLRRSSQADRTVARSARRNVSNLRDWPNQKLIKVYYTEGNRNRSTPQRIDFWMVSSNPNKPIRPRKMLSSLS